MISSIISRVVILLFGTLYPAYASYKAVRTKNLKEYVKWMMYWIVFALFTCAETFTDVFLSWFPFYYEIKIILVLWLLSPATKGSSILYRKFVHPALSRREQEIDDAISKAKEQGYHTVLNLGTKGVNYATTVIMQTAIRGGGGLVQQLRKSYSLSDLTESIPQSHSEQDMVDEADDVLTDPRLIRRNVARSGYNPRRSASESNNRTPLYFSEVDVDVRTTRSSHPQDFSHIKSSEDISSGYSSADNSATREQGLSRTGSVGGSGRLRARQVSTRSTITTIKRPGAAEGSGMIIEELHDNDNVDYDDLPPLHTLPPTCHISQTSPPFLFEYVGNQIRIIKILGDVSPSFIDDNRAFDVLQASQCINADEKINKPRIEAGESSKLNSIPDFPSNDLVEITPSNEQQAKTKGDIDKSISDNKNILNVPSLVVDEDVSNKNVCNKTDDVCNKTDEVCNITEDLTDKTCEIKQEFVKINISSDQNTEAVLTAERKHSHSISSSNASLNSAKTSPSTDKEEAEVTSIGTSSLNDDAVETDDEASYGTPEDSPKTKKKTKRGKYGKSRAPAPPKLPDVEGDKSGESVSSSTPMNNENETAVLDSEVMKEIGSIASHSGKPTSDAYGHSSKNKHKSKSPTGRKPGSSPISKLMQLPGKLAFWHKAGDKEIAISSSEENSRRSSTIERADDFQNCLDLQDTAETDSIDNGGPNQNIPTITLSDSVGKDEETGKRIPLTEIDDLEEAKIAKDILDKSDALQKLIEAKLESHPEYKTVHGEESPTLSRSTEV